MKRRSLLAGILGLPVFSFLFKEAINKEPKIVLWDENIKSPPDPLLGRGKPFSPTRGQINFSEKEGFLVFDGNGWTVIK